jgi:hypothetical protein
MHMIHPPPSEVSVELNGSVLGRRKHTSSHCGSSSPQISSCAQNELPDAANDTNPVIEDQLPGGELGRPKSMSPSSRNHALAGTQIFFSREASAAEVLESLLGTDCPGGWLPRFCFGQRFHQTFRPGQVLRRKCDSPTSALRQSKGRIGPREARFNNKGNVLRLNFQFPPT